MTPPANANVFGVNPKLTSWPSDDRSNDGGFNPVPLAGGPAATGGQAPGLPFFTPVTYRGAFEPGAPSWLSGWTMLDQMGFLGDANACPILIDGDLNGSLTVTSSDIISLVNYVFKGGAEPEPCAANGDVNCSGAVSSADVITLVNFVFKAGAPPCDICNNPAAQVCN